MPTYLLQPKCSHQGIKVLAEIDAAAEKQVAYRRPTA
jgi:hypothetical protein